MSNNNTTVFDIGVPPSELVEWETWEFRFHEFRNLSTERGSLVASPEFTYRGHQWSLGLYPGGREDSSEGMVSVFLDHLTEDKGPLSSKYRVEIKNWNGQGISSWEDAHNFLPYPVMNCGHGLTDFATRADILQSLASNGALVFVVKLPRQATTTPFIPENPSACKTIQEMFMDAKTADIVFEVGEQKSKSRARKESKVSPTTFHAHRVILQKCANTLADMCGSGDGDSDPIPITDVNPDIFKHMLFYIYGGKVEDKEMKLNVKEIIEATDKYGLTNLKREAEACLVNSTTLDLDNMMEHLLYADSKNCALLKEAAMDFVVKNKIEILEKVPLNDLPQGIGADMLAAMARGEKKSESTAGSGGSNELTMMCISELRRRAHEKGLEVDGSRESLIASLKQDA